MLSYIRAKGMWKHYTYALVELFFVCKFNEREIRKNSFENVQKLRQFTETIAVLQHSDHSGKKSAFPISLKTSLHIIRWNIRLKYSGPGLTR